MSKTRQAITILVTPEIAEWPEWAALQAEGHEITVIGVKGHIILGPLCWRMNETLRPYLREAIAAAKKAARSPGKV